MKKLILQTELLPHQLGLFYLGQTGYLMKYNNKYVVVDAYLSDYVDRNCCNDLVTWTRRYPAPIAPEELDFVDYVFCTHAHFDHADPTTLSAVARVNQKAKFFVPAPIVADLVSYGIAEERIIPVRDNENITLTDGIEVRGVKSAHEVFHTDENGDYRELGYRFNFGGTHLYHSGDCCPYDGLEERLAGCDILIVPINGRDYYRTEVLDIIGCFDSREAVTLAKNTGAKLLIPTHYDLYDVNCVNPAHFVDTLMTLDPTRRFHLFAPGERYIYAE